MRRVEKWFAADMNSSKLAGHGAMFAANAMWGPMSPVAKFAMSCGAIGAFAVTEVRIVGAAALFWIASFFQKPEHVRGRDMMKMFAASMLAIVFNQGCFIFGVKMASPVDASIITTSMPLIALVLSAIFLKEVINGRKVIGISLGAAGALMLVMGASACPAKEGAYGGYVLGDLLVLFAQFSYALYIVLFKGLVGKYSPVTIMKWMFTYSFLATVPFSYGEVAATNWNMDFSIALSLAFVVVGGTFGSYMLLAVGQRRLRPTVAGMYNYIQPLVASIVAICWGMDSFSLSKIVAAMLIFSGVYMVTVSEKSRS